LFLSDSWFFIPLTIILALLCIVFLYLLYIRWIFVAYLVKVDFCCLPCSS
jgi:hypothetical protein